MKTTLSFLHDDRPRPGDPGTYNRRFNTEAEAAEATICPLFPSLNRDTPQCSTQCAAFTSEPCEHDTAGNTTACRAWCALHAPVKQAIGVVRPRKASAGT